MGVFAYVHLMSRLSSIIVVVGLWECKEIFDKLKVWTRNEKALNYCHKENQVIKKWLKKNSRSYVSLISICFTMIIVITSSVNIFIQSVMEVTGGKNGRISFNKNQKKFDQ